jgi:hypothetical protein
VRVSAGAGGTGWVVAATSRAGIVCRISGGSARPVAVPAGCVPTAVQSVSVQPAVLLCADAAGVTAYHAG